MSGFVQDQVSKLECSSADERETGGDAQLTSKQREASPRNSSLDELMSTSQSQPQRNKELLQNTGSDGTDIDSIQESRKHSNHTERHGGSGEAGEDENFQDCNETLPDADAPMFLRKTDEEMGTYLTLSANEEGDKSWFRSWVSSKPLKDVLENYKLHLCKLDETEVVKLVWDAKPNTMYNFTLNQTASKQSQQKSNTSEGYIEFVNLQPGHEYKIEVNAEVRGSKKQDASLKFRTCPKAPNDISIVDDTLRWDAAVGADRLDVQLEIDGREVKIQDKFKPTDITKRIPEILANTGKIMRVQIHAIGKQNQRNTLCKDLRIGGDTVPCDASAVVDELHPRSVFVRWGRPNQKISPKKYLVSIKNLDFPTNSQSVKTDKTSHEFHMLMSNSRYVCSVAAKYANGDESAYVKTAVVVTKKKQGISNQANEIDRIGKVTNFHYRTPPDSDNVKCVMSWEPAELGIYENDYERRGILAEVRELKSDERLLPIDSSNEKSAVVKLDWGRRYKVIVTAKYKYIDTQTSVIAVSEYQIETDFLPASDIKILEFEKEVKLSWTAGKGVAYYLVKAFDTGSNVVYDTTKRLNGTDHTFTTGPEISPGNLYTFQITAFNTYGASKNCDGDYFLGEKSPTNVRLSASPEYRTVELTWGEPRAKQPDTYEYSLYYDTGNMVRGPKRTDQKVVCFTKVKHNQGYYAVVEALFGHRRGYAAYSPVFRTNKGQRSQRDIAGEGRPKQLDVHLSNNDNDYVTAKITWKMPTLSQELEKDYDLRHFIVQIFDKGTKDQFNDDVRKPLGDELIVEQILPRGSDYLVRVKAVYMDIDNGCEVPAQVQRSCTTDIPKPKDLKVQFVNDKMQLSWSTCKFCVSCKVEVLDAHHKVLEERFTKTHQCEEFPIKGLLHYGKSCFFRILVTSPNDQSQTYISDEHIIGGDDVPYDVDAQQVQTNPCRWVTVSWKKPKSEQPSPTTYEVVLSTAESKTFVKRTNVEKCTRVVFKELKSSTEYVATVAAKYDRKTSRSSPSNTIKTAKAPSALLPKFSSEIWHTMPTRSSEVSIRWRSLKPVDDYKVLHYDIKIECPPEWFPGMRKKKTVFTKSVNQRKDLDTLQVDVKDLLPNIQYTVTVKANLRNIDSEEETSIEKEYKFHAKLGIPVLQPIQIVRKKAIFTWTGVEGVLFDLDIFDALHGGNLKTEKKIKDSTFSFDLDDKLRIGMDCRVKLRARSENDSASVRDGESIGWCVGGKKVPRNVTVKKCPKKPSRCIYVDFEPPACEIKPSKYIVYAHACLGGRRKEVETTTRPVKVQYLRSGTEYRFEVFADFQSPESGLGSTSKKIFTDSCVGSTDQSALSLTNMPESDLRLTNVTAHASNVKNFQRSRSFDEVCDLKVDCLRTEIDSDVVDVSWSRPLFDNNPDNFRVDFYNFLLETTAGKTIKDIAIPFKEGEVCCSTGEIQLEFGKTYTISVKCTYEDLDNQQLDLPSHPSTRKFRTKPCKPEIYRNVCDEKLEKINLEWSSADGADKYKVEIFTDGDAIAMTKTVPETTWSHEFNEKCRFGKTYRARVTAIGGEKENHSETTPKIIGGDSVPREAKAVPDVDNPTTMAIVTWKAPDRKDDHHYTVETHDVDGEGASILKTFLRPLEKEDDLVLREEAAFEIFDRDVTNDRNSEKFGEANQRHFAEMISVAEENSSNKKTLFRGKITELKPGTKYRFKVYAVFSKHERSGGYLTNEITTNPGPGKVQRLNAVRNIDDASTKVDVSWEEEEKCTFYKVVVQAKNAPQKYTQEKTTKSNSLTVEGLSPGSRYRVFVVGGNDNGFGNPSQIKEITTDYGTASFVKLITESRSPQNAMVVNIGKAQGNPTTYKVAICKNKDKSQVAENKNESLDESIMFDGLLPNTEYYASVAVGYNSAPGGEPSYGELVKSTPARTAPRKPNQVEVSLKKVKEIYTNIAQIKWHQDPDCDDHEIQVLHGGDKEEHTAVVRNALSMEYHCMHRACEYRFSVRSKNDSRYFGEWSEETCINLVPEAPDSARAELLINGGIRLEWSKAKTEVKSHVITAFLNDKPVEPEKVEHGTVFALSAPHPRSKYQFSVAAEDAREGRSAYTESNVVYSAPEKMEVKNVETADSTTMQIMWDKLQDCSYEIRIRRQDPENKDETDQKEESLLQCGENSTACTYTCQERGIEYSVEIRAKYMTATGPWSEPTAFKTCPGKVEELQLALKQNSLKATWKPPSTTPSYYKLQVYEFDAMKAQIKKAIYDEPRKVKSTDESFHTRAVTAGKAYVCEVTPVNDAGEGEVTKSSSVFVPWSAPTYFIASPVEKNASRDAIIKWDKSEGVDSYKLVIQSTGQEPQELKVRNCEYYFQGGEPGTKYDVVLSWGSQGCFSEEYREQSFTLAPAKIEGVSLTEKNKGGVRLQWETVTPNPQHYVVEWEVNGKGDRKNVEGRSSFDILCGPGDTVIAKVAAVINESKGEYSDECKLSLRPIAPRSVEARHGELHPESSLIVLIRDYEDYPRKYVITCKKVSDGTLATHPTDFDEFLLSNLDPGESYVVSAERIVRGMKSLSKSRLEPIQTYPGIVEVKTHLEERCLLFTWDPPTHVPKEYHIEWRLDVETSQNYVTSDCVLRLRDPLPGSFYSARVAVVNSAGVGNKSEWKTFLTAPGKIGNISAKQEGENVVFDWATADHIVEKFLIECRMDSGDPVATETIVSHYRTEHAKPSHSYHLRVRALNETGPGEWSDWKTYECVPGRVSDVSQEGQFQNSIKLRWDPLLPNTPKEYVLEMMHRKIRVYTKENAYEQKGLKPATTYRFRIGGINETGSGELSAWTEAYTAPIPPKITDVEPVSKGNNLRSFVVTLEDESNAEKMYIVKATPLNPKYEEIVAKRGEKRVEIKGLKPAVQYNVVASTMFRGMTSEQAVYIGPAKVKK